MQSREHPDGFGCEVDPLRPSAYPKVNLAVGYAPDPGWPRGASDLAWRYVTGAAVDHQDRVWVLNALAPQVRAYSAAGDLYLGDVADDSPTHRIQKFIRLPAEA